MQIIEQLEKKMMRFDLPDFVTGDTVKVHVRIKEGEKEGTGRIVSRSGNDKDSAKRKGGEKERIQIFQGVVISKRKGTTNSTFTVRKISYGIGVERIFLLHSPVIAKIEVVSKGRVRRAKIYYLRNLKGKAARIKERRLY